MWRSIALAAALGWSCSSWPSLVIWQPPPLLLRRSLPLRAVSAPCCGVGTTWTTISNGAPGCFQRPAPSTWPLWCGLNVGPWTWRPLPLTAIARPLCHGTTPHSWPRESHLCRSEERDSLWRLNPIPSSNWAFCSYQSFILQSFTFTMNFTVFLKDV